MGILEQLNNPIPTYCPETFTEYDLIKCIYEFYNYKKMNEETTQETYSLNDGDIEEVLNNMTGTSTTTEETSEEPVAVEPVDFEDDEEDNSEEYDEDEDEEEDEEPQEELTVESSLQRIRRILTDNADEEHSRFRGAPWYEIIRQKVIMIAGMGGIGSWLSLLIARLNPRAVWMYDDDMVEIANM